MSSNETLSLNVTATDNASDVLAGIGRNLDDTSADLERAGNSASGMGDKFSGAASTSSQFAGGLGDLGGALSQMDGPLGAIGGQMEMLAPSIMGVTGAADLLELATGKVNLANIRATASTMASRAANVVGAAATGVMTGAQWLLNAAMSANPVMLVVLGIIALVAIFVIAWQHSETFRTIVTGAFDAVLGAAQWVWQWVSENWPLLLAILTGPIGLAVLVISRNWDSITAGFTKVKDGIGSGIDSIVGFVTGLPGRIGSAASGAFSGLANAFVAAVNWMIRGWNKLSFTLPSVDTHIPGIGRIGGWSINTPDISEIPSLWQGATVLARAGGTVVRVSERGRDESVVDTGLMNATMARLAAGGGGGGNHYHFHADGVIGDKHAVIRWMRDTAAEMQRQGLLPAGGF